MSRLSESMHPAYHLRPNKAVDRFLLLEMLRTLEFYKPLNNYSYISLGGPFLEDFRLISQYFPKIKLICVEEDGETIKRQQFHVCSSRLKCVHSKFGDYIASLFPTDGPAITWADYTDMTRECLGEVSDITRKSLPGSLVRVTVRAETPVPKKLKINPYRYPPKAPNKKKTEFEELQKFYSSDMALEGVAYRPEWFAWKNFSTREFPLLLARMLLSVARGACTHPKKFVPLHNVIYSDGTIMLSVTGVICLDSEEHALKEHFKNKFEYFTENHDTIDYIDLPSLTTKERLCLDEILPTVNANGDECIKKLGYLIEGDNSEHLSKSKMQQFEKYYRLYPYFGKIMP